ncbi:MBL fold metallo-hydrolase, partial [Chloroflexota bacterium]
MNIRILGAHNCESENTRLSGILIDDKIAVDAGSLSSGVSLDIQENLTAVLLTHHHYDHIRDMMSVGMNNYLADTKVKVYSIQSVYDVLNYLFDSNFYHDFMKRPEGNPTINFTVMEPHKSVNI